MDNKETLVWLKNNPSIHKNEIKKYLTSKMDEGGLKESWQKHYFLEDLKKSLAPTLPDTLNIINDLEKDIDGVPMFKRYLAYIIDLLIVGLIMTIIDSFDFITGNGINLITIVIYLFYFIFCTYKFKTTVGLFIFKTKIKFESTNNLLRKIFFRELLFLIFFTGIGAVYYFIRGAYWDKATNANVIWLKKDDE